MAKTTSYVLGDHFNEYIGSLVTSGRYKSATEVMTDALRVHEERTRARQMFLEAVDEGMKGSTKPLDFDAFFTRMDEKHSDKRQGA